MAMNPIELPMAPHVWRPVKLEEAWGLMRELGEAAVVTAGSTLLRTQWESGAVPMKPHLISLDRIRELRGVQLDEEAGRVRIGAFTSLSDCRALDALPLLSEAVRHIAAPSIRRLATLGGNVCSGIGDSLPALLVQDADLVWYGGGGVSRETLTSFLEGKGSSDASARGSRLLVRIEPSMNRSEDEGCSAALQFYYKVGRREAFVPSLVTVAGSGRCDEGGQLKGVKLAAGGGTSIPVRLYRTEELLNNESLTTSLLNKVYASVMEEHIGYSDAFASLSYRRQAAANLVVSELWKLRKRLEMTS